MKDNSPTIPWRAAAKLLTVLWLAVTGAGFGAARAADSAVVITYHRFGENAHPSTNIRLEQFEAQIEELASGPYTVLPLPAVVEALKTGKPLPDRAVAITIDDAYRSVFTEAWPRLRAAGLPFTLFVLTDPVTRGLPNYMTWDQVRALRDGGVTIGAHTDTHLHMADATAATNRADIARSTTLFRQELGEEPVLFAYPYGETSGGVERVVREAGYAAAFGQQSGAVRRGQPLFYLPRFPINEALGGPSRFRLVVNSLPLPVRAAVPEDPLVLPGANPPAVAFSVEPSAGSLATLACYRSRIGKTPIERRANRRVEIRLEKPFRPGHTRLNCTQPGPSGRWRWFGMQFYLKP